MVVGLAVVMVVRLACLVLVECFFVLGWHCLDGLLEMVVVRVWLLHTVWFQ